MNGGAWLTVDGLKVDVMLRDLDVVGHWSAEAAQGRYEVDARLGDVAGAPTYGLMAELAVSRALAGTLPEVSAYPPRSPRPARAAGASTPSSAWSTRACGPSAGT